MIRSLLLATVAAAALTACSASTNGSPQSSAPLSNGSASASPSSGHSSASPSASASSSAAPSASARSSGGSAHDALLDRHDLGPGFVARAFPGAGQDNASSPCLPPGSPSLNDKYPPSQRARITYVHSNPEALVAEQVSVYGHEATARNAMAYAQHSLSCRSVTVHGQRVQISSAAPVRSVRGQSVDLAQTWNLSNGPLSATLVAVRLGAAVVSLEFVAEASTDVRGLPAQYEVVVAAVKKAKKTL